MSAAPPSVKRHLTDAIGAEVFSEPNAFLPIIASLPSQMLSDILAHAAHEHPDIAARLVDERNKINAARVEQAKTIDFEQYSVMASKAMKNVEYRFLDFREQWEKSKVVAAEVHGYIDAIGKATSAHATSGTKKSALETLHKIGKSIISCDRRKDNFGFEMINHFVFDYILEATMLQIAENLTVEERTAFMEFNAKLLQLEKLGKKHLLFMALTDVRRALLGEMNVELNLDFTNRAITTSQIVTLLMLRGNGAEDANVPLRCTWF